MPITQDTRTCQVTSPLGDDALFLTSLDARERVSGPFQFNCRFLSGNEQIDFKKIIGQSITLELEMAGGEARYFNGLVARFSQSDAEASGSIYQAQIVPWFWFLTRRTDCRIFQGDSVIQILEKLFGKHKQIADYKLDIEGSYDPIPYCVQYRESDFHFASRLMEEWGIGYYFEHKKKAHKMILFNAPSKIAACPGQSKASCHTGDAKTSGHVSDLQVQQEFRSGAYALTDYNYRDPGLDLGVQKKTQKGVGGNDAYEIFDYPGDYQALGAGDKRAQLRIEAEECASNAIHGNSNCYGFAPGYKFDLTGHVRDSFNDTYLITEVHHTLSQSVGGGRGGAGSDYRNSFSCVPHAIPYRPLLTTPKPTIQGVQTATVVGEGSKEIDIDELGCVVVKFHWDRKSKGDATSSCRIRVSEAWGGKGWGAFFAPRIGQEVIVEFLEGDPDRPIITGRVYNGSNTPPYSNGNQSGLKTRSTMKGGAGNFNELRFDDTKGGEEVYLQAEKNLTVYAKNSKSETIDGAKTIVVGGSHQETITGSMSQQVNAAKAETILAAKALTVGAAYQVSVGAAMNTTVVGAKMEEVGGYRLSVVGGKSTENVGSKDVTTRGKFSLTAGEAFAVTGKKKGTLQFEEDASVSTQKKLSIKATETLLIESESEIILRAGKAEIVLKKEGGKIEIKGAKVVVTGTDEVKVKGGKVSIN